MSTQGDRRTPRLMASRPVDVHVARLWLADLLGARARPAILRLRPRHIRLRKGQGDSRNIKVSEIDLTQKKFHNISFHNSSASLGAITGLYPLIIAVCGEQRAYAAAANVEQYP